GFAARHNLNRDMTLRVTGRINDPQSGYDIFARRDCANAVLDAPEIANSSGGKILTVFTRPGGTLNLGASQFRSWPGGQRAVSSGGGHGPESCWSLAAHRRRTRCQTGCPWAPAGPAVA